MEKNWANESDECILGMVEKTIGELLRNSYSISMNPEYVDAEKCNELLSTSRIKVKTGLQDGVLQACFYVFPWILQQKRLMICVHEAFFNKNTEGPISQRKTPPTAART